MANSKEDEAGSCSGMPKKGKKPLVGMEIKLPWGHGSPPTNSDDRWIDNDDANEGRRSSANSNSNNNAHRDMSLSLPVDSNFLSEMDCFLRSSCVELFISTGGEHHPLSSLPGQVGLRCIHCRRIPLQECTNEAVCYPTKREDVHECVKNFERFHLNSCPYVPPKIMARYQELKRIHGPKVSHQLVKAYCAQAVTEAGLIESPYGLEYHASAKRRKSNPSQEMLVIIRAMKVEKKGSYERTVSQEKLRRHRSGIDKEDRSVHSMANTRRTFHQGESSAFNKQPKPCRRSSTIDVASGRKNPDDGPKVPRSSSMPDDTKFQTGNMPRRRSSIDDDCVPHSVYHRSHDKNNKRFADPPGRKQQRGQPQPHTTNRQPKGEKLYSSKMNPVNSKNGADGDSSSSSSSSSSSDTSLARTISANSSVASPSPQDNMQTAEELQDTIEGMSAEFRELHSAKEDDEMHATTLETDLASLLQDTDAEFVKLSSELEGWKRMANKGKIRLEGMQTKVDNLEKERDEMNMQRSADTKKIESLKSKLDISERSREEDMQGLSRIGDMEDEMERWKRKANREKVRMEGMQVKMNGLEKERDMMKFQHKKDIKDMESVEERCTMLEDENRKLRKLLKKPIEGRDRHRSRDDRKNRRDSTKDTRGNNEEALLKDTSERSCEGSASMDSFMGAMLDIHSPKSPPSQHPQQSLRSRRRHTDSSEEGHASPNNPTSTPIRSRRCSNEERPSTPNSSSQAAAAPSSWHGGKAKKGVFMVPTKGCSPKDMPQDAASPASWHGGKKKGILKTTALPSLPLEEGDRVSFKAMSRPQFPKRSSSHGSLGSGTALQTLNEMEEMITSMMGEENEDGLCQSSRSGPF